MNNITYLPVVQAERLRSAVCNWKTATIEWGKATLALAEEMYRARQEHASNRDFRIWLIENDLDEEFNGHDRAALISMGEHIEITRLVLEESDRRSVQLIWEHEIKGRLASASKTVLNQTETEESQKSVEFTEEKAEEPIEAETKSDRKKSKHGVLAKLPKGSLVMDYVLNSNVRSAVARITNKRKGPVWDLLVEAIESGAFGDPVASYYTVHPTLRLILPWAPTAYAHRFDLTKSSDRDLIRNDVLPVVLKHRDELKINPDRLQSLVQDIYRSRQSEREEKRRQESIAKMPEGQQKIIAFGEIIWPRINDAPYSYDELCLAIWFFNFTVNQLQTNWDAKSRALQMQQMLKWLTPVCKFPNWPTAVRKLCAVYSANPDGRCEFPPPPVNFGIS